MDNQKESPCLGEITGVLYKYAYKRDIPLIKKIGLILPTSWIGSHCNEAVALTGEFIRQIDLPQIASKGIEFIQNNPELFYQILGLSGVTGLGLVSYIHRYFKNFDEMINHEREKLNPWFIN